MQPDGLGEPVFTQQDRSEGLSFALARGKTAVYSAPSPERSGLNEDAAAVIPVDATRGVLAVADGLGGQRGGEAASREAVRCVADSLSGISSAEHPLRASILDGVERANRKLMELGIGAATTLAIVEIAESTLRPYHVGDSAILVVGQRGRLKLQTVSHSPVGYALESGLLDEDDALHHDELHIISNMVGSPDMRIEVGAPLELAERDTVLLATDGLLDNMNLAEIVECIRAGPLDRVAESLVETCTRRMHDARSGEPCKPDDLTFILFRRTVTTAPAGTDAPQPAPT